MVANPNPKKFIFVLYHWHEMRDLEMLSYRLYMPEYVMKMYQKRAFAALGIVEPYQRVTGKLTDSQAAILL